MSILVLGVGNDILGDDAVGLLTARRIKEEFDGIVDVIEAPVAGFALMEYMEGYKYVLLLDAIVTGEHPPGTILELTKDDFKNIVACSPHYVGIPEIFRLAENLNIAFPDKIYILAMEVENPFDFQECLSPSIEDALPQFTEKAREKLLSWRLEKRESSYHPIISRSHT